MVANRTYTLKRAILTWKEAVVTPTPTPTLSKPSVITITITCVKGKVTKKITAVNPKCPAGYKKK
ncbi:MAG: hypothetical protein KGP06_03390 [Acidobacteria bacterium]|nr:hypothetical protein [Acidobacteriota bacterium]